jgi:ABC-type lipoprotein release transport system permease subunit
MGGNQALFDRWCAAAGSSAYLPEDNTRAIVLGAAVAKRLLVSVGDEVTVQVVRARDSAEADGPRRGALSQRRLEVTGVVRTGNPEIDDRVGYLHLATLTTMLGTDQPNELVMVLDHIRHLPEVRQAVAQELDEATTQVYSWEERNPALKNLIATDSQSGNLMYVILILLVALGVVNATLMSVLERTREFGVMLALGMRRFDVFAVVMLEVALLGLVAIAVGGLLGGGLELFGRIHGWPMEWFGGDQMSNTSMSGIIYEPIYYSALSLQNGLIIMIGVYTMFLLSGLLPALRAARLQPVQAMRQK